MRLRHIEIFNAVYTCGSISSAARFLNLTQPTVSKTLKHAEDQLGYRLFHRLNGRLVPTTEGKKLFIAANDICKRVSSLRRKAAGLGDDSAARLRIAAETGLGLHWLPQSVARFRRARPQAVFEIQACHFDNLCAALYNHEKDIGLALNPPELPGVLQIPCGRGEFLCIYSGSAFPDEAPSVSIDDISRRDFISIRSDDPIGDILTRHLEQTGRRLRAQIVAQTPHMARDLVELGAGVAIVDEFTARMPGDPSLKIKALDPPVAFEIKALHLTERPPSRVARQFIEHFASSLSRDETAAALARRLHAAHNHGDELSDSI